MRDALLRRTVIATCNGHVPQVPVSYNFAVAARREGGRGVARSDLMDSWWDLVAVLARRELFCTLRARSSDG